MLTHGILPQMQYPAETGVPLPKAPVTRTLLYSLDAQSYAGTGTVWTDDSGNGWNADIANAPTYTSAGANSYFTFNAASSQYVTIPYSHWNGVTPNNYPFTDMGVTSGGVNFTAEFVVKTTVGTDQGLAVMWGSTSNRSLVGVLITSQERIFYGTYYSGNKFTDSGTRTGTPVLANNWLHIVHTSDVANNASTIYVNGSVFHAAASNQQTAWQGFNTRDLILFTGDNNGTPVAPYWDGEIAVARAYDSALTAAEVSQQYTYYSGRYTF